MKILLANWNNVYDDVIPELLRRGHQFVPTTEEADLLMLWNETGLSGRPQVEKAHKLGKKVITLQHGRYGSSRVFPPFNENIISDKFMCWGEGDVRRLLTIGTKSDILQVVGSPILKHLKPRVFHKEKRVVFCPEHWGVETLENLAVATELKKLKLKKVAVTSKLLEGEHSVGFYPNPVVSRRGADDHLDKVTNLLSSTDLVVSLMDGTFELLAEAMDIPVILVDIWKPRPLGNDARYLQYRRERSNACSVVKELKDLNEAVMYHLKHPEILREERRQVAIDDGGINIQNPVGNIINVAEGVVL